MADEQPKFFLTTAIDYPNSRPHIGTAFEKLGADVQARYRRMEGYDVFFLMGNDENTVKVAKRGRRTGPATRRRTATTWPASSARSGTPSTSATTTSSRPASERHQAVLPEVHPEGVRQRLHLQGRATRAGTARAARRSRPRRSTRRTAALCPIHKTPLVRRSEPCYFFALSAFQDRLLEVLRGEPRLHPAGEPAQRDRQPGQDRGCSDVNITPHRRDVGHPRAVRRGVHHLRLVRRPADLHHRHRLRRRRGDVPQVVAGRHPLHRQGHHALPLRPVAGDAAGRRAMEPPQQVFGHGFVYIKNEETGDGREDQQVARQRRRADGDHHEVQRRGVPLLLPARVPVPRRRRVQLAALRGGLQRRPGEQPRQPVQPGGRRSSAKNYDGVLAGTAGQDAGARSYTDVDLATIVQQVQAHVEACRYNQALQAIWQQILDPANQYADKTGAVEAGQDRQGRGQAGAVRPGRAAAGRRRSCSSRSCRGRRRRSTGASTSRSRGRGALRGRLAAAGARRRTCACWRALEDGKVKPLFPRIG